MKNEMTDPQPKYHGLWQFEVSSWQTFGPTSGHFNRLALSNDTETNHIVKDPTKVLLVGEYIRLMR